jgi:hypothetical protein
MHQLQRPQNLTLRLVDDPSPGVAIEDWKPEDPRRVDLFLELSIGWDDWDNGYQNIFFIHVVTNDLRRRPYYRRKEIVLQEYRWLDAKDQILHLMALSESGNWDDSFSNLRQRFEWYYEGSSWHGHEP